MKIRFPIQAVASFLALSLSTTVFAAQFMSGHDADKRVTIEMTGPLVHGDDVLFQEILNLQQSIHPSKITLRLSSPGGDLEAGLSIGELVREAGIHTEALGDLKAKKIEARCEGACVFIWLGGVTRKAGLVGLIKPRFNEAYWNTLKPTNCSENEAKMKTVEECGGLRGEWKKVTTKITNYCQKMGAPSWFAMKILMAASSTDLHYLDQAELDQLTTK